MNAADRMVFWWLNEHCLMNRAAEYEIEIYQAQLRTKVADLVSSKVNVMSSCRGMKQSFKNVLKKMVFEFLPWTILG